MSEQDDKVFIPLENNPEVMNSWVEKAGVDTSKYWFEDVYGLSDELLGLVSQPVKAVVFLYREGSTTSLKIAEEDKKVLSGELAVKDPDVLFVKQNVHNICGTMAIVHSLLNTDVEMVSDSPVLKLKGQCKDTTDPNARANLLEASPIIKIHEQCSYSGQSAIPPDLMVNDHFTAFVKAKVPDSAAEQKYRVVELDGGRVGAVDRGPCNDFLKDVATYIQEDHIKGASNIAFSITALVAKE